METDGGHNCHLQQSGCGIDISGRQNAAVLHIPQLRQNPTLVFKFPRWDFTNPAWFLNSYVGNDKSLVSFQIPAWDFTNPSLVFKFLRGK